MPINNKMLSLKIILRIKKPANIFTNIVTIEKPRLCNVSIGLLIIDEEMQQQDHFLSYKKKARL